MFEVYHVMIIPLILGLVELCKRAGVKKRYLPFIALLLGIVIGVVYVTNFNLKQGIIVGAMLGLSASGLYSGTKNTMESDE
ncbi:hypothetical protein KHA93_11520 [Bacillus sp. FJAT-49732]|uniref:Holin n=1 Tax=Lederbergia citrisecunda TaxID=2833583 RepID=A0A942TQ81_9BACI|nr:hypothetical protein [Lederbergia citrisecunda]MBS4200259.1 hypothetical protein [Lederbergia citrisecunda]